MASEDAGLAPPPPGRSARARRRALFTPRVRLARWEYVGEGSYGIVFRVPGGGPGEPPRIRKVFVNSHCQVRRNRLWEAEAAALRRAAALADRRGRPLFPRLIDVGCDRLVGEGCEPVVAPFIEMEDGGVPAAVRLAARGPGQGDAAAALLRCAKGLLAAVAALHETGLWHFDLSAMNLLVPEDGRALLADLGGAGFGPDDVAAMQADAGSYWAWPPEMNLEPPRADRLSPLELLRAAYARYGPSGVPWDEEGPPPSPAALDTAREVLRGDFPGFARKVDAFMAGATIVHMCAIWLEAEGEDLAAPLREGAPPASGSPDVGAVRSCLAWAAPLLRASASLRPTPAEVLAAWGRADAAAAAGAPSEPAAGPPEAPSEPPPKARRAA